MARRADQGEDGIMAVLAEIQGFVRSEREKISAEPFLTEALCRFHLPRIEEMQVRQIFPCSIPIQGDHLAFAKPPLDFETELMF